LNFALALDLLILPHFATDCVLFGHHAALTLACCCQSVGWMDGSVGGGCTGGRGKRTLPLGRLYENTFLQLVRSTAVILILNLLSVFENVMLARGELSVDSCCG